MIVVGIDPGTRHLGVVVVEVSDGQAYVHDAWMTDVVARVSKTRSVRNLKKTCLAKGIVHFATHDLLPALTPLGPVHAIAVENQTGEKESVVGNQLAGLVTGWSAGAHPDAEPARILCLAALSKFKMTGGIVQPDKSLNKRQRHEHFKRQAIERATPFFVRRGASAKVCKLWDSLADYRDRRGKKDDAREHLADAFLQAIAVVRK